MVKAKKSSKKITQKVQAIVQADVFKSIAIASVLLNILFLVTIVVLTSTSTFDRKLYTAARERYCNNTESIKHRAEELGSKQAAKEERQIDCLDDTFSPFFQEAVEKYRAQPSQ